MVEQLFANGFAQVVYSLGHEKGRLGGVPRYRRYVGRIEEGRLSVKLEDGNTARYSLSQGKLELSSKTEVGEAQETLSVDYDGDDVNIGFNARYLLDFLGVVGTDAVKLEFNPKREGEAADAKVSAGDKPGQFKPMDDGMDYRYVVMPMHL